MEEAANDLEHIGDLIEVNMVNIGQERLEKGIKISQETQKVMNTLHMVVSDAYSLEIEIIEKLKRIYYHAKHVAKSVLEMSEKEALVLEAA